MGYEGGGPYRCILISHGGGVVLEVPSLSIIPRAESSSADIIPGFISFMLTYTRPGQQLEAPLSSYKQLAYSMHARSTYLVLLALVVQVSVQ